MSQPKICTQPDLSDSIDKLGLLFAVTAHTPPVLLFVRQLGVAGAERDEVAGVRRALGTPDTAEHRPQLGGVRAAGAGTDEILGLSWNKQSLNLVFNSQSLSVTEVKLSVGRAPHGIAVVDADVFSFLDVDRSPNHHPVVSVKVFAGVVDAGVFEDGDVGVQGLGGGWSDRNLDRTRYHVLFNGLQV